MAGFIDINEAHANDYHYFFGEAIERLVEERDWNFEALPQWDSEDPGVQVLIDAYLAYLTDEPGAEALSEEDEETALDAQRTEWRLHKDDMEIVWSYDPSNVVRVSDNFPAEVMAFLKEHAPAFNGEL